MSTVDIRVGDCRDLLRAMPAESVHCVVTSPPYFGLRDYGVAGQIGLEPTPDAFVAEMVAVFREVRRVLRGDGTLWLNLGDSYATGTATDRKPTTIEGPAVPASWAGRSQPQRIGTPQGYKTKDLLMIPARVALALQADGWWLRSEIIWAKPNPMPESVTDRPTSSHEKIFLFAKSARYFYDAEAVKEPAKYDGPNSPQSIKSPYGQGFTRRAKGNAKTFRGGVYTGGKAFNNSEPMERDSHGNTPNATGMRNLRNVWTISPKPFAEAHFATFPPALIEPCIKAGCPRGGVVLDPFGGAGTTGLVADRLGRNAILLELNPAYASMARRRIYPDDPFDE